MPTPLDEVETFPQADRPPGVSPQATEWTDVLHERPWLEAETRQKTFDVGRHGVRPRPAPEARAAAAQLKALDQQQRDAAAAERSAQREAAATDRIRAADLRERGIPSYRDSMGAMTSPVTDETGAPLTHYDPRHGIAYDSTGSPRSISYDSVTGPPKLKDPFEGIPPRTDFDTGDIYQVRPGLPWKWVGADQNVKNQRDQEERDKAIKAESALLGTKISTEHAELVSGEAAHKQMTKDLVSTVPELTDPKYSGADRDTIVKTVDKHFDQEYGSRAANERAGLFSDELSDTAKQMRAGIDQRKASTIDLAHRLYDLKDKQLGLGDRIGAEQAQRADEVETLIQHGRGMPGPLDSIQTTSSDDLRAATANGDLPTHIAPAAIAAAHDAEDAQNKENAARASGNDYWADQYKALHQGIRAGLLHGVSEMLKGASNVYNPAVWLFNPSAAAVHLATGATPDEIAGTALDRVSQRMVDDHLKGSLGQKVGSFIGNIVPWVATAFATRGTNLSIPIMAQLGFSSGFQERFEDAKAHGVPDVEAAALGVPSGAINAALLAFPGTRATRALAREIFGGSSAAVITDTINSTFERQGAEGVGRLFGNLRDAVQSGRQPLSPGFRAGVTEAIDNILGEIRKTGAQRVGEIAKAAAYTGAAGAGAQVAENVIGRTYNPEQGIFEGVPEQAIGFGALGGISEGFRQVLLARQAKQALDVITRGGAPPTEPAAPARPAGLPPVPPEGGPPSEPGIPTPEEPRAVPEVPAPVEPERPAGPPGVEQPVVSPGPAAPAPAAPAAEPVPAERVAVPAKLRAVADQLIDIQDQYGATPEAKRYGDIKAFDALGRTLVRNWDKLPATERDEALRNALDDAGWPTHPALVEDKGGWTGSMADLVAARRAEVATAPAVATAVDQAAHEAATSPLTAALEPTTAQKEAGNYEKGHVQIGPLAITIENPAGSQRSNLDSGKLDELANRTVLKTGTDFFGPAQDAVAEGNYTLARQRIREAGDALARQQPELAKASDAVLAGTWATPMQSHYGYIKGTVGTDKDQVDVFIKPGTPQNWDGPVYVVDQQTPGGQFDEHKAVIGAGSHEEAIAEYQKNQDPTHRDNFGAVTEFPDLASFKKWAESGVKGPAEFSKGVAKFAPQPTDAVITQAFGAHAETLGHLEHGAVPKVGEVPTESGFWTQEDDSKAGATITVDPEKVSRVTEGMTPHARQRYIARAIDEEVKHVAAIKWEKQSDLNKQTLLEAGAEKDELDTHMGSLYEGWDNLSARQKGHEKIRFLLQGEKPTETAAQFSGRLGPKIRAVLRQLLSFIRTLPGKVSPALTRAAAQIRDLMKGIPTVPPVEAPPPAAVEGEPVRVREPGRRPGIMGEFAQRRATRTELERRVTALGTAGKLPAKEHTVLQTLLRAAPKKEPSETQLAQARRIIERLEGKPYAKQPSPTQVPPGEAPVGVEERPSGEKPRPGDRDYVVGEAPGAEARGEVPGEAPAPREEIEPARPSGGVPGIKVSDVLAQKLKDLAEGLGATAPVVQKQLPKEKRALALEIADGLIAEGVNTPEKLAGALPPALHSYAQSMWDIMAATGDVPRGTHDWAAILRPPVAAPEPKVLTPSEVVTKAVKNRMLLGQPMKREELTKLATANNVETKVADEAAEVGVVQAAREVVKTDRESGRTPKQTFDRLVEMYGHQPNLTARTATSKLAQAYSTPVPLAYAASVLGDVAAGKSVYEPTAGNGMLLIEGKPKPEQLVIANELEPARVAQLKGLEPTFEVTAKDATTYKLPFKVDRVIENPPFGTVKDEKGESRKFPLWDGETTSIDQAIVRQSLDSLKDDGRATLIISGTQAEKPEEREKFYGADPFYKQLYDRFGVIDHFTVAGDLYKKQGAGWPVDVILIQGKGKSQIRLPSALSPRILTSWEQLGNELGRSDEERIAAGKLSEREATEQVGAAISAIEQLTRPGGRAGPARTEPRPAGLPRPAGGRAGVEPAPGELPVSVEPTRPAPSVGVTREPARGEAPGKPVGEHEQRGQLGIEGEGYPEPDIAKYRVPYKPKSKNPSFGIFTPTNLEAPQRAALEKVEKEVGNLDKYVAGKLGYKPNEPFGEYFSAEQIDGLALMIYAAEKGEAGIIGDQGGVGKGRMAAGMMLYAREKGLIPVFFTKDEKLYKAMLEDFDDIGRGDLQPLFTNNGMRIRDHRGKMIRTGNMMPVFQQIADTGELPADVDMIFSSYFQIQNDLPPGYDVSKATRITLKARKQPPPDGPRMSAFKRIAPKSLFIMDESHLASGDSIRAWRFEPLLRAAPSAYYSSATFAKRPDSIGIYFRTTLSHAAPTMAELIDALSVGGVPLQQASIAMLAEDGLYMRRERDFGKSEFHTHINLDTADRDRQLADTYTSGLRRVLDLASRINRIADNINKIIKSQGKRLGATSPARLESTNFAATIHNLVSQYLLAIKTKATVDRAVEHIKNGRRVVAVVQNTMESAINQLRARNWPLTFNGLLLRLIEQQRTLKARSGRTVEEFYIKDEPDPEFANMSIDDLRRILVRVEVNEEGQKVPIINTEAATEYFRRSAIEVINEVTEYARSLDLGEIPLSPIDEMRYGVESAGFKTAEITGRGVGLTPGKEVYEIRASEHSKRAQLGYMDEFNNGDVRFLVMNASGSTGISLHSSTKFKKQDQRAMLIAQPHLDIAEFMQSLWRIDRTGQVHPPYFEVIQTAIPAELRPAAVREKKMGSLNANTTSNAKNELRAQDLDIFNEFGDEVVHGYLRANESFLRLITLDQRFANKILDGKGNLRPFEALEMEPGKLVAGVTGRLAIFPSDEGEEFWRVVNENYRALIQYLDDTGQNTLRVAAVDMRAETLETRPFTQGDPSGTSVFDGSSYLERIRAQIGKAPRKGEEVLAHADEVKRQSDEITAGWRKSAVAWQQKESERRTQLEAENLTPGEEAEAKEQFNGDKIAYVRASDKLNNWQQRTRNAYETIYNALGLVGETVHIHNDRGLDVYGAVIAAKLDEENPLVPSKQEFTVWVNSTMRQIRLSAAQLEHDAKTTPREHFVDSYEETAERSNERYVITGNLLAASASLAGQVENSRIIVYTDAKGELKQGILLPANFNPNTFMGKEEVQGVDHFKSLLNDGRTVTSRNQAVTIMKRAAGVYELRVPAARNTGEKFWGNHTLRSQMNNQNFVQKGSQMVGVFGDYYLPQVFQTLTNEDRLGTQLFFNRPTSQTGTQTPPTGLGATPPAFARDYWSEDVKPFVKSVGATTREVLDSVVHTLSPTHGVNKDTVDAVMSLLGERNQVAYVVDRTGEAFEKMFRSMPRADLITFIDRVKLGEAQPTTELAEAARFIRKVDEESWSALNNAAKNAGIKNPVKWLENHYRVMWKKIPGHAERGEQPWVPGRGKRPLRGSRAMAKQHTLETMSDGIEEGGVPYSYNPITNEKMALADIWKYTTALKVWAWGKENGMVSFVRGAFPKLPDGMAWLDDSIADVWFPAESGEGLIHAGKYAVEEGFGRLLNNFLSRDLVRQTQTGRTLMWIKNATTALELALSLFHGVFETGEVIGSNIGLGLSQIYNRGLLGKDAGALMTGLTNVIKSIATPRTIATLGATFRRLAGKPDEFFATPAGKEFLRVHPDAREMIGYLFAGGWKPIEVEADWKNNSIRAFTDAVADLKEGTSKNYLGAGLRAFPAANEFLMMPLFDVYIPNLKIGQFVTEMREALRQNDLKFGPQGYYIDRQGRRYDRPTNAELARKVWRFVEDRFGELNYDTLFWNNTFKSGMQLLFRSVTWKLGSVEAFYGAFAGQGKEFVNAARERRAPELHRNMAWLFGVFLATAVLGTVISTVLGKHKPRNLTDLMFPRIDPNDDKVRVSIPTYIKDLFHLIHSPEGYVKASLAGWIGRVADLLSNKDYYGVQIRDTDDPIVKQALQMGKYTAETFLPFSVRGYKNLSGSQQTTVRKMMALFGVMPAPRYIGQTAAEQRIEKFWAGQRTEEGIKPEQFEVQRTKRELVSRIRKGLPVDISSELEAGKLKPREVPAIYKRAQMGYLASSIDRMPLDEAEKVYAAATPDERAQLAPIIARKRAGSAARSGRTMYAGF